jgi:hypothetical protein
MSQRTEMIKRELDAYKDSHQTATYSILFRGNKEYLPVIRISPKLLLLNHKNNRLSGQLRDHTKRHEVEADPQSTTSQKLLHSLLAGTEKFKDLSEQLKVMGQEEPGLITRDGLLVNGNTRVAALRELKIDFVEVAVLPNNINDSDVLDMEMSLQVKELIHQDYTFTNQLLLMRKFLDSGNTAKALASKMAWVQQGIKKVETHMRLLSYIDEVRNLSDVPVPYSVFDSKKQHLKDLDNDYVKLKNEGDIDAAESLKWTRLFMTFLRLNKDQVRAIDSDFIDKSLLPRLGDEQNKARAYIENYRSENENDDLDDLLGEQTSKTVDMKKVLKNLLSDDENRASDGDINTDLKGDFQSIAFNARRAAENIIDEQKLQSANAEPSEALKEAKVKIASIRQKVPFIIRDPRFKAPKFMFDLKELIDEIKLLEKEITKNMSEA